MPPKPSSSLNLESLQGVMTLLKVTEKVEDIVASGVEAFSYQGFDMAEWIRINVSKIAKYVAANSREILINGSSYKVTGDEGVAVVINLCVLIGMTRGNSTDQLLIKRTKETSQDAIRYVINATGHKGREKGSNKKYKAEEFTFLRSVAAFPHIASAILVTQPTATPIKDDILFSCENLPVALHHGNTYAMSAKVFSKEADKALLMFYVCSAVSGYITMKVSPIDIADKKKMCLNCESFVMLQGSHPMYIDAASVLSDVYIKWGITNSDGKINRYCVETVKKYGALMEKKEIFDLLERFPADAFFE